MRKIVLAVFLLVVAATVASANTLTLTPVTIVHQYQQTTNNPCVIGDNSCNQPAGMLYTLLDAGSATSYDAVSPTYTVGQLTTITGGTFIMGIDINQSSAVQTLTLVEMYIDGNLVDTYSVSLANAEVPPTTGGGNGNGYADYILTGFTSLTGYNSDLDVYFHIVMPSANDGAEEFFLISAPAPPQIPEPSSLMLLGTGLLGAAGAVRRKFFS